MILFKKTGDLHRWLDQTRNSNDTIGFVPTMGALHEGHISLIDISKRSAGITVCSVFVNPTQFNDPKDYQKYPITIEKDIALLEAAGVDALFLPEVGEMYPNGTTNLERYDLGRLETILEGKYRPGHFRGVCRVMRRLLDLVRPDDLFMGSKDYQQCMIVQRLIQLMDWSVRLHRCPIVREPDGLAMSSRNARLSPDERQRATAIYQALLALRSGAPLSTAEEILAASRFRTDYISICDPETLEPVPPSPNTVALIAAFQGEVRLIDNMIL
ncbi:pantoate--beta-alanine ligase [Puia sp. P3]|uniref:pantoate--beta-alanine ligase n=1 Tax=Puia sp. P3 TaxID=3423952 RepID=UPI003D67C9CB